MGYKSSLRPTFCEYLLYLLKDYISPSWPTETTLTECDIDRLKEAGGHTSRAAAQCLNARAAAQRLFS